MQFGFSGHGDPAVARWSIIGCVSVASCVRMFWSIIWHFAGSCSHVPP